MYPSILGDANGDGAVGLADLTALGGSWGANAGWSGGDFNLDEIVGLSDLTILGGHWGTTFSGMPSSEYIL